MSQTSIEVVQQAYDSLAESWNETLMRNPNSWWLEVNRFLTRMKRGILLDAACGVGREAALFRNNSSIIYHGFDISPKSIALAQKKHPGGVFKVMDARNLEYPTAFFDGIWCVALIHHLSREDAPLALQEMRRVVKPGVPSFFVTPNGWGEQQVPTPGYPDLIVPIVYWDEDSLVQLLMNTGFQAEEVEERNGLLNVEAVAKQISTKKVFKQFCQTIQEKHTRIGPKKMAGQLEDAAVASALSMLSAYPRVDAEYSEVLEGNMERPEVAIITGVLLGYPLHDIVYYIKTRYLKEFSNGEDEPYHRSLSKTVFQWLKEKKWIK